MGEFFKPYPPKEHRCVLPRYRDSIYTGYRCECGKAYLTVEMGERDRGVDPSEPNWQWQRAPQHDKRTS